MSTDTDTNPPPDPGEWANNLAEKINAGDVDPQSVDVEAIAYDDDKIITPALADALGPQRVEEYNEYKTTEFDADLQERKRELSEDQRAKLDTIKQATEPDEPLTETIPFGDEELAVTKRITGAMEEKINHINENRDDLDAAKEAMLDVITSLIESDGWDDRAVWEAYYYEHGSEGLAAVFELVAEPALQRRETLFREREERLSAGTTRNG